MDKYEFLGQLGDGTFGCVLKALHKKSGQVVAIKKMKQKYYTWEDCVKLPEVVVARHIQGHPNIIKMREVVRENNELFFVFEYMDGDLLGVIRKAKQMQRYLPSLAAPAIAYLKIKNYTFQIMQALAYLHRNGYFHRDMKPENLLIRADQSSSMQEVVKLADFGLAKEIRARQPFTDYVSTRWYRAPELLLQDRAYGSAVDIWAMGCIVAELITTRPLFPGSNEVDQLHKIIAILGSPNERIWPGGVLLAKKLRYSFPVMKGVGLERVMPAHTPPQLMDLLKQMLNYDPKKRPTAQQCLQHPYFNVDLDGENVASDGAAKNPSSAAKLHSLSPQSAPSGAVPLPAVVCAKRAVLGGVTTAVPKNGVVEPVPPLQHTQKKSLPSPGPAKVAAAAKEEENKIKVESVPASTPTPVCEVDDSSKKKSFLPKTTLSVPANLKSNVQGGDNSGDGGNCSGDGAVDLDDLLNDFASELQSLGLLTQRKQHTASSNATTDFAKYGAPSKATCGKTDLAVEKLTSLSGADDEEDSVKTFLNSTRYKKSLTSNAQNGPLLQPLRKASLLKKELVPTLTSAIGDADAGGDISPALSLSLRALLAKHVDSGEGPVS